MPLRAQVNLSEFEADNTAYMDIIKVDFYNTDVDYNVVNDGELNDVDVQYVTPVIMYDGLLDVDRKVTVSFKLYNPSGELVRSSNSPQGYTWDHTFTVHPGYNNKEILAGWGSSSPTYGAGTYQFEIWYKGKQLFESSFTVEKKTRGTSSSVSTSSSNTKKDRNSELYQGSWKKAFNNCIVHVTESYSGDVYKGELKNGLRDGIGLYVWDDGGFYIGNWKKDKRDGFGIYMAADGYEIGGLPNSKFYCGFYTNSSKEGQGASFDKYGNCLYVGLMKDDEPEYKYPNESSSITFESMDLGEGMFFVGQVIDGEPFGFGMFISEDGDMVYGMYQDGKMEGKVLFLSSDGDVESGTWEQIFGD